MECLIATCDSASDSGAKKVASRRLTHLESSICAVSDAVSSLDRDAEPHLLRQYQEQLTDTKGELADIRRGLLSLGIQKGDKLETTAASLDKQIFNCGLQIKRLLYPPASPLSAPAESADSTSKGVRLPKLNVPTFDRNILTWQTFWEQFCIAVHDHTNLTDAEKLVYFQNSLKDGSAKSVIEGLSRSGEHYNEAIKCLRSHYDCPWLIHQTHIKGIVKISPLKEGSEKELRRLHDVAQHLRALKTSEA